MSNVINAVFGYGKTVKTREVWKIDHGMKLKLSGIDLPTAYQVHFANAPNASEATVSVATSDTVDIPDAYFQTGADVYAWIYLTPDDGIGYTVYMVTIPVKVRPAVADYQPTPVQEDAIDQAIAALNQAVEQTGEDVIAAGEAKAGAEVAQGKAESAQSAAEAAQGMAELAARDASSFAYNANVSASQSANSAAQSETAQHNAEAARDAAHGYSDDAADSATRAEQAATTAGYMAFHIDERGHLIYTRVGYHDTMFSLRDGHLILGVS